LTLNLWIENLLTFFLLSKFGSTMSLNMSFGNGAGKGSLPRRVKGEAFRAAYDSIKKPESLDALLAEYHHMVTKGNQVESEQLYAQIEQHPYYRGKP